MCAKSFSLVYFRVYIPGLLWDLDKTMEFYFHSVSLTVFLFILPAAVLEQNNEMHLGKLLGCLACLS